MSSRKRKQLHPAKARYTIKALSRIGFSARHTKGSHVFLKHTDGRTTVVPVHQREEIDRTLLRKIAAGIELPQVHTEGDTLAEVKKNMRDALTLAVDYLREKAKREKGDVLGITIR